eukprot:1589622-Pyramimonas_sp.AAC.1
MWAPNAQAKAAKTKGALASSRLVGREDEFPRIYEFVNAIPVPALPIHLNGTTPTALRGYVLTGPRNPE